MSAPLESVQLILGITRMRLGDVLFARGNGCPVPRFIAGGHLRSHYAPNDTPADVTVSKTECSRQPTCSVEC